MPQGEVLQYAALLGTVLAILSAMTSTKIPDPYMDEIFHVDQAQRYCRGEWTSWNSKITTLPGLYVLAVIPIKLLSLLMPDAKLCVPTILRSVNCVFAAVTMYISMRLVRHVHRGSQKEDVVKWISLCMTTLPILFFFNLLFYTDAASTMFVLATYYCAVTRCHRVAAVCGLLSVFTRQSNIVWVMFSCGVALIRLVDPDGKQDAGSLAIDRVSRRLWVQRTQAWGVALPYLLVAGAFAAFIVVNGSVVVGDQENHVASLHLAQPLYFGALMLGVCPSFIAPLSVASFVRKCKNVWFAMGALIVLAVCGGIVHRFTVLHPFLLADNRHYTFYFFKNVIRRFWFGKFLCVPFEAYGLWSVTSNLATHHGPLFTLGFWLCTVAALAASPLVEVRYFIVPALLVLAHHQPTSTTVLKWTAAGFAVVNLATLAVFVLRPFTWGDGTVARFMW